MKTAVITIKTDPKIKLKAQKVVDKLGLSLSGAINAYLHELVRTQEVSFSLQEEKPSKYLMDALKESEDERKRGEVYSFGNPDDALTFIDAIIKKKSIKRRI